MVLWLLSIACTSDQATPPDQDAPSPQVVTDSTTFADRTIPTVTLAEARTGRLPLRRRTNGLLRARRQITIKAFAGGELTQAPTEGAYYKKDELLIATDTRDAKITLARVQAARNEADYRHRELRLRMQNAANTDTLTSIQAESMLLQSGLPAAEVAVREAELFLSRQEVRAPFAGRIADVTVQVGDQVAPGEEIGSLIDLTSLEAEFNLLEKELAVITTNSRCYVQPSSAPDGSNSSISATIDILNPKVDEGGLLRARAKLGRIPRGLKLYPGMNVSITIEDFAPSAVLVPKVAVVIRTGRQVVFVYDPTTQRTDWRYVTVSHENDETVAITEGITAGEQVITSGNLTLDHDIPVHAK